MAQRAHHGVGQEVLEFIQVHMHPRTALGTRAPRKRRAKQLRHDQHPKQLNVSNAEAAHCEVHKDDLPLVQRPTKRQRAAALSDDRSDKRVLRKLI